jgi:hypothetical protein
MRLDLTMLAREHVQHMKLVKPLAMDLDQFPDRYQQNLARQSVALGSSVDTPQPSQLAQHAQGLQQSDSVISQALTMLGSLHKTHR